MFELFKKTYYGIDDLYDLERDINEAFDPSFNPPAAALPTNMTGELTVVMTYKEGTSGYTTRITEV